jgi:hypothetical protein
VNQGKLPHCSCAEGAHYVQFASGLEKAGLANITATYINLLGYDKPEKYEPSLLQV